MSDKRIRKFVSVTCGDCGKEWDKRKDTLKQWAGRCRTCAQIERAKDPEVRRARSESAKNQVAKMGGIPGGNRFTSEDGGENHWNWKGGIYKEKNPRRLEMGRAKYRAWRKAVFERDDYTCQECGKRGGWLDADHIKPWAKHKDKRYDIDNGRTLCRPCHIKTDTWGKQPERLADAA